nr:PEF-CTERM sorting domain-containing protein [uncultured Methanolobus sp.]
MKKLLIALVVLLAMAGNASAFGANVLSQTGADLDEVIPLAPGTCMNLSLELEGLQKYSNLYYSVDTAHTDSEITVHFIRDSAPLVLANPFVDLDCFYVEMSESAVEGQTYTIAIDIERELLDANGNPIGTENEKLDFLATATQRFNTTIPEFPTIALPVAAIIGLAFFIQRRKQE